MATSDTEAVGSESAKGSKWRNANLRFDLRLDKWEDVFVQARAYFDKSFSVNAQTSKKPVSVVDR